MKQEILSRLRWLTHKRFRLAMKSAAWAFENALVALGALVAIPLLYRGFDLRDGLMTIENFIDHVIWRENRDALLDGLWLALFGLFVIVCLLRLPAFFAMRAAEREWVS